MLVYTLRSLVRSGQVQLHLNRSIWLVTTPRSTVVVLGWVLVTFLFHHKNGLVNIHSTGQEHLLITSQPTITDNTLVIMRQVIQEHMQVTMLRTIIDNILVTTILDILERMQITLTRTI